MVTSHTKHLDPNDTIVAISSATGPGARAIVRLSGRRAAAIVGSLCMAFVPRRGHFATVHLTLPGFHTPIPADIYHFAAPRSYTGQDVIEMHLISCGPILDVVIAQCLSAGARAAQSGEFTLRAFLSGKLDLTRAEAVLGVIEADSRDDLTHALKQLAGGVAQPLGLLRDDLLNLLADVEAGLDFADEDIHFVTTDDLLNRITRGLAQITLVGKQLEERSLSQRPFRVVLAGKTNAGKSSLFNALLGRAAALVDAEPGTTRDYLEARHDANGAAPILFVDTAGQRVADEPIEQAGQSLAREQMQQADLILWCAACDDPAGNNGCPSNAVRIATKADLAPAPPDVLATSTANGTGLNELRALIEAGVRRVGRGALAPSLSRCANHIAMCLQHLRRAYTNVLGEETPPELLALDLRLALEELGAMTGAIYTDDLLDRIFSRFCIGK